MTIDFKIPDELIVASHITGIYDVNRSTVLANDDFSMVSEWAKSIAALGLQGIVFHNNLSESTCKLHQSDYIHFVKVAYNPKFSPNVFRYFAYSEFLNRYAHFIKNIFFTDISDVEVLKNPFRESLYINNPSSIFCGNEPKLLADEWMQAHSQHLRSKISGYATYETNFKNETLLNCGIIGGDISMMHPFINQLKTIHEQFNADNNTAYTGDMGAFNYLVRTRYNTKVIHGSPVNTVFKTYSADNLCWFKHK